VHRVKAILVAADTVVVAVLGQVAVVVVPDRPDHRGMV
jgi:hypothetical protein